LRRRATGHLELWCFKLTREPDTADELRAVARSLGASSTGVKLGKEASERVLKGTKLDEYRIVHFATHALVASETALFDVEAEPALALSLPQTPLSLDNGLLTSSEVAALKLNADWVDIVGL
jgi:CHAT domain-containing protein